jgi:hypothetical protein
MGYQQSIVKLKADQLNNFMFFLKNNEKWMNDRGIQPNCMVRVAGDIELYTYQFKKDEVCVVIDGERHFQRGSEPDGLIGLEWVESIIFIDNVSTQILDEYFPRIEEEEFYKQFQNCAE